MFIGLIFLSIGVIVILNAIFGLNLPAMRILFGVFLLYMVLKVLFGSFWPPRHFGHLRQDNHTWGKSDSSGFVFSRGQLKPKSLSELEDGEFNVVFVSGTLDLTELEEKSSAGDLSGGPNEIEINTVFGESLVVLPKDLSITPLVNSVFGSVSLPSDAAQASTKKLTLKINTVFG